jgi:hypothetical protein
MVVILRKGYQGGLGRRNRDREKHHVLGYHELALKLYVSEDCEYLDLRRGRRLTYDDGRLSHRETPGVLFSGPTLSLGNPPNLPKTDQSTLPRYLYIYIHPKTLIDRSPYAKRNP